MRISTAQMFFQGLDAMQRQQAELARTQRQVASGQRLLSPADDPAAAKRILDLKQSLSLQAVYKDNSNTAADRLALEDTTLGAASNVLQRLRELAIQGNNDSLSDGDRQALALEASERLGELLGLANTRDAAGEFLFAGTATQTRPFISSGTAVVYAGDQGQRHLPIGQGFQVAVGDPGSEVFMAMRNGNGTFAVQAGSANAGTVVADAGSVVDPALWSPDKNYTVTFTAPDQYEVRDEGGALVTSGTYASGAAVAFSGIELTFQGTPASGDSFSVDPSTTQSVFATAQNLIDALNTPTPDDISSASFHNEMNQFLADIDQAAAQLNSVRAGTGARLNAIDNERDVNLDFELQLTETLSRLRDLDLAEAVTRLNQQLGTLQAAQQSFVQVQNLSLFNFL